MKRLVAAVTVTLAVGATPALAQEPTNQQRRIWNRVCVAAGGEVSPQVALVCVHYNDPEWPGGQLRMFRQVCEGAIGGTFVGRSEAPVILMACFV